MANDREESAARTLPSVEAQEPGEDERDFDFDAHRQI